MYTTFLQWVNHILLVSSKQCVHALYPLFECPDKLLRAGQSLIVTNSNARRVKFFCLYSSHIRTPSLPQSNKSPSTNGLSYTSMSFPSCFGPGISTGIMMNFHFMQSHGGRLYIQRVTGQVLWPLLISPKGFMPSYSNRTLCFSHPIQIQGMFYLFFSTVTHQRGVSASSLTCVSLCAITST